MALSFNSQGNLHRTVNLSYEEFLIHFGTNPERMRQIANALHFFKIFKTCGCTTVYVDGSFVSKKEHPGDIDLCFDITSLDKEKLKHKFPEFFDSNMLGKIHREFKCHILYFTATDTTWLNMLEEDRDGNQKGLVRLDLHDIDNYD